MGLFCIEGKVLREGYFFILAVFFRVKLRRVDRSAKEVCAACCFVCPSWCEGDFKFIVTLILSGKDKRAQTYGVTIYQHPPSPIYPANLKLSHLTRLYSDIASV